MCCEGKEIEYKDLRTPGQQQMMQSLLPVIMGGIQRGATPFGGMLSQPPDPSVLNAMNVMSNVGGQGNYNFPGMQVGPYPQPQQPTPPLFNYGPGRNRPNERPWGDSWEEGEDTPDRPWDGMPPWRPPRDPYMPWYPPA